MAEPDFVKVISFVELMVVVPKSIPLAAPARFNSRLSIALQFHLQPAFHFLQVQRAADGQFAQWFAAILKMQRGLLDFRRRHVAIQRRAERGEVIEHAAGAGNIQLRLAGGGGGFQIRRQREIEIALDGRCQKSAGAAGRIFFNPQRGRPTGARRTARSSRLSA